MLIYVPFLEIPLLHKVSIQTVKVKIDVHAISETKKKPKKFKHAAKAHMRNRGLVKQLLGFQQL